MPESPPMSRRLFQRFLPAACIALVAAWAPFAHADEPEIRKALAERYPSLPMIDEVNRTPMQNLWEVRIGSEILYTDAKGQFLIQGELIDTASRKNLTEERVNKLSAIDFNSLPLKDAIVWKAGNGSRKIVQFADPNCPYCKRFEHELSNVKNVTVYTFLLPILGGDSPEKAKAIWCSADPAAAWRDWMVNGKLPPKLLGKCETPLDRNLALGRKYRITGTPSIVFEDGTRAPGAMTAEQIEERLAAKKS